MLDKVRKTITRYNMLPAGSRAVVAVSGGADSVCLLFALKELAAELQISLSVAHFNHQLRGEVSDEDEHFVGLLAKQLDLPFHRASRKFTPADGNLEQAGRKARQRFFGRLMEAGLADRVALGHTVDDQAETVLFRLMRGSGLKGIAGIHPVTDSGLIRPFIEVSREEVEKFLRDRGVQWREDQSNSDPQFARNRIRHALLPDLERQWNPKLRPSLAHFADLAYEEERWWREHIAALKARMARTMAGTLEMNAPELAALPRALSRRLIREVLAEVKGDLRSLAFGHVERVLELAACQAGEGKVEVPGVEIVRSFKVLRFSAAKQGLRAETVALTVPGTFQAPDLSRIHLALAEHASSDVCVPGNGATLESADLDFGRDLDGLAAQSGQLELRGWRAGDHYQPQGHPEDRKIKDLFQRAKVPSWQRVFWPIVTYRDSILWVKQFGPAVQFAAQQDSSRILRLWNTSSSNAGEDR